MMAIAITLVPVEWTRDNAIGARLMEPIVYEVVGLPAGERSMVCMCPGGWRVLRDRAAFDGNKLYGSAEEAAAALKAFVEGESLGWAGRRVESSM